MKQTVYIRKVTEQSKISTTSTPKEEWGVHEHHCCLEHGCKYGDKDCPVAIGLTKQVYDCEDCGYDQYDNLTKLEGHFFTEEQLLSEIDKAYEAGTLHKDLSNSFDDPKGRYLSHVKQTIL